MCSNVVYEVKWEILFPTKTPKEVTTITLHGQKYTVTGFFGRKISQLQTKVGLGLSLIDRNS